MPDEWHADPPDLYVAAGGAPPLAPGRIRSWPLRLLRLRRALPRAGGRGYVTEGPTLSTEPPTVHAGCGGSLIRDGLGWHCSGCPKAWHRTS
jgi:hypothetical protein